MPANTIRSVFNQPRIIKQDFNHSMIPCLSCVSAKMVGVEGFEPTAPSTPC